MKTKIKRLSLNKETIRVLDGEQMQRVDGMSIAFAVSLFNWVCYAPATPPATDFERGAAVAGAAAAFLAGTLPATPYTGQIASATWQSVEHIASHAVTMSAAWCPTH